VADYYDEEVDDDEFTKTYDNIFKKI